MQPTGTVTFVFTDVVGSTRLWDERPDLMPEALRLHDELVQSAIERHGGRIFSTGGDGFAAVFQRVTHALSSAVEAQAELRSLVWPFGLELTVRIGIDTGETVERNGDYFGPTVNRAARVMSLAPGGRILVSEATAAVLDRTGREGLADLGPHALRGFREHARLFGVVDSDHGWPAELLSESEAKGNVPRPATGWIGPLAELRARSDDLPRRRLVTLTGPGGVGKTRTAIEIASLLADEFAGGTWFLDLAPLGDQSSVIATLASIFGVAPEPGTSLLDSTIAWLSRRRLLLIVDNCEHLIDDIALIVGEITRRAERVTVLATSREPLGVRGERVAPLRSLDRQSAFELFRETGPGGGREFRDRRFGRRRRCSDRRAA